MMRCVPTVAVVLCFGGVAAGDAGQGQPPVLQQAALSSTCGGKETPSGALRVTLRDQHEEPLSGATVTVLEPKAGVVLAKGTTGPDGSAMFPAMAGRPAYVVGAMLGFHSVGGEAYVASGCDGTLVLTLPLDAPICLIEVTAAEEKRDR